VPSPSDLFLSPDLSEEDARAYLRSLGFRDAEATDRHLQSMADDVTIRQAMGRIAGELLPALLETPDPDAAVVGLSHYLAARSGRPMFLDYLADDPRAMHVLTCVFGSSPLLSEVLIHNSEYFHWLVAQVERSAPDRQDLEDDLDAMLSASGNQAEALAAMRRWKWREILRIGTCDLLRRETVPSIARQLSDLADVIVNRVLTLAMPVSGGAGTPGTFAVIALGPLGGREMSYASHVELMFVFDASSDHDHDAVDRFQKQGANLTTLLSGEDADPLYRTADVLFHPLGHLREHYASRDDAVDRRRLLKARPIAGDAELGRRFLEILRPLVFREATDGDVVCHASDLHADFRNDPGDIARGVEACVQALQLTHGARHQALQQTGTLDALNALAAEGLITGPDRRELAHAYEFLKGATHRKQLMPGDPGGASENLEKQLREYHARVDEICTRLCGGPAS
jgi:[glutamine synthetase] adenylyltransferase / [glutamine synthetase]-adenylyl-L-tyrosine phosphorylase